MIRINRNATPSSFLTDDVKNIKQIVASFFERNHNQRVQEKFNFPPFPENIKVDVTTQFKHKCAYCESKLGSFSPSVIDNFRPKRGARGLEVNEFYDDLYWWLAYEWENLYLACPECNFQKASWFPVTGVRAFSNFDIINEFPLIIDPCSDNPAEHFVHEEDGSIKAISEKGKITIEILKLNRENLVKSRKEELQKFKLVYERVKQHANTKDPDGLLGDEFTMFDSNFDEFKIVELFISHPEQNFVGLKRQFLFNWLENDSLVKLYIVNTFKIYSKTLELIQEKISTEEDWVKVRKYFGLEDQSQKEIQISDKAFSKFDSLERVLIKNFRNVKELDVSFSTDVSEGASWLLFLGENGLGKSTILQAITLALMPNDYRKELNLFPSDFLLDGNLNASVTIHLVGHKNPIVLTITRDSFSDNNLQFVPYLLAYGATRLMPQNKITAEDKLGTSRVANLFDPTVALHNASEWLYKLQDDRFEYMVRGLRQILMLRNQDRIIKSSKKNEIIIKHIGGENNLVEMSEGYKTVVALATDIMQMLEKDNASLDEAKGVVIIDELETHLHPRWKMRIVSSFRAVFPQVQFIVTTHDPLCLRGLRKSEAVLMKRDKDSHEVNIYSELPSPEGYRVDQLLTSNFFGLHSTIDPKIEDAFDKLYKLLAIKNKTNESEQEIEKLKNELKNMDQYGDSIREELMYDVIDELLAKEYANSAFIKKENLKAEVIEGVKQIWQSNKFIE